MSLTASYIETCRIASARDATGGGVLLVRIAASAAEFHDVTTSALARRAVPSVRSKQAAAINERFIRRSVRRALANASTDRESRAQREIQLGQAPPTAPSVWNDQRRAIALEKRQSDVVL